MNLYDFTVEDTKGQKVSLKQYAGKVVLVVNSATGCGFTPQYEALEALYSKLSGHGFVILDFPCDQFGHQAPGTDDEIVQFCTAKYKVSYPIFHKIEVNGSGAIELFKWLKGSVKFEGLDPAHKLYTILCEVIAKNDPDWQNNNEIKWNFTKFLIDRQGNPVRRFEPTTEVSEIEKQVETLL